MTEYVTQVIERLRLDPALVQLNIVVVAGNDLPPVSIDPSQFQQVLSNLILNSADVSKNVRIELRLREDRFETLISDDGPGIPNEVKDRIFEPFFTTRTRGTGLGLAIAQSIIQAHGGEIRLEPVDQGACFVITVPLGSKER